MSVQAGVHRIYNGEGVSIMRAGKGRDSELNIKRIVRV